MIFRRTGKRERDRYANKKGKEIFHIFDQDGQFNGPFLSLIVLLSRPSSRESIEFFQGYKANNTRNIRSKYQTLCFQITSNLFQTNSNEFSNQFRATFLIMHACIYQFYFFIFLNILSYPPFLFQNKKKKVKTTVKKEYHSFRSIVELVSARAAQIFNLKLIGKRAPIEKRDRLIGSPRRRYKGG